MGIIDAKDKFLRIAEGWKNVVFKSPLVEKLAQVRAKICSDCPHAVESSWLQTVGEYIKEIKGLKCGLCNCPLSAKTRSVKEGCAQQPNPKW